MVNSVGAALYVFTLKLVEPVNTGLIFAVALNEVVPAPPCPVAVTVNVVVLKIVLVAILIAPVELSMESPPGLMLYTIPGPARPEVFPELLRVAVTKLEPDVVSRLL
jgi:hypothetical protein